MKVTPLELRQRQFTTVMRGYDRAEVNTFLAQAADDFETLMLENDRLRQEAGKAEAALSEHRGQEKQLSNTLLTAQKIADDIREKAQQDAARFISEAEGRIAMMVEKSQVRVGEVQREIESLRTKRREVEISLEGLVTTLNKTIDSVRDRDVQHEERTSLLLPPDRRFEKPSVVLPLKDPSGSGITPAVSSSGSSTTSTPPATPGPSVVLASAPSSPAAPAAPAGPAALAAPASSSPSAPSTSAAAPTTPAAPATSSTTTAPLPATPSLLKPTTLISPSTPATPSSTPSTPPSGGPSAVRPSVEAQPSRP